MLAVVAHTGALTQQGAAASQRQQPSGSKLRQYQHQHQHQHQHDWTASHGRPTTILPADSLVGVEKTLCEACECTGDAIRPTVVCRAGPLPCPGFLRNVSVDTMVVTESPGLMDIPDGTFEGLLIVGASIALPEGSGRYSVTLTISNCVDLTRIGTAALRGLGHQPGGMVVPVGGLTIVDNPMLMSVEKHALRGISIGAGGLRLARNPRLRTLAPFCFDGVVTHTRGGDVDGYSAAVVLENNAALATLDGGCFTGLHASNM